jgi:hypothetical protein
MVAINSYLDEQLHFTFLETYFDRKEKAGYIVEANYGIASNEELLYLVGLPIWIDGVPFRCNSARCDAPIKKGGQIILRVSDI